MVYANWSYTWYLEPLGTFTQNPHLELWNLLKPYVYLKYLLETCSFPSTNSYMVRWEMKIKNFKGPESRQPPITEATMSQCNWAKHRMTKRNSAIQTFTFIWGTWCQTVQIKWEIEQKILIYIYIFIYFMNIYIYGPVSRVASPTPHGIGGVPPYYHYYFYYYDWPML